MPVASGSTSGSPPEVNTTGNKRRGKKRMRSFTADERATHSAIEKQRREALNANFIDLARLIPALAPVHRLSKALIVSESIKHLQANREMCLSATSELKAILAENIELAAEINGWREQYGVGMSPRQIKPVGDAVKELLKQDQQVYGTFPAGFGDNGPPGGDREDDQDVENDGRPQMEGQNPASSNIPPEMTTSAISNADVNFQDDAFLPVAESQQLLEDPDDLTNIMGMPRGLIGTNQMAAQHLGIGDEDPFSSLEPGYDVVLESHHDGPHNFADLNLDQNMLGEFPPDIDFYLPASHEMSDFGYVP